MPQCCTLYSPDSTPTLELPILKDGQMTAPFASICPPLAMLKCKRYGTHGAVKHAAGKICSISSLLIWAATYPVHHHVEPPSSRY